MGNAVFDAQFKRITSLLFEIGEQISGPSGYLYKPDDLEKALQSVRDGLFGEEKPSFEFDKREDGWTLHENESAIVPVSQLEIVSFLKRRESSISGEKMRSRAKKLGANFGQAQAEYLLDHQAEIPASWRNYYLVFPGTVWRCPGGDLDVPYLDWRGGRWDLLFDWLGDGWDSDDRLVVPGK